MHWFWNGPGWSGPNGFWGFALGGLINLLFLVAVVALIVWVVRLVWRPEPGERAGEGSDFPRARSGELSALELLNRRYARGEIDRETYLAMKRDLQGDSGSQPGT